MDKGPLEQVKNPDLSLLDGLDLFGLWTDDQQGSFGSTRFVTSSTSAGNCLLLWTTARRVEFKGQEKCARHWMAVRTLYA